MMRHVTLAIALFGVTGVAVHAEPLVRHTGEWETIINDGKPIVACFPADATFDQNYVMQSMSKVPGGNCKIDKMDTAGTVITYAMECTVGDSIMTSSGTITATGSDSFTNKVHSHGGAVKMPNGQVTTLPDSDMTIVSHRLGPCKPGDRIINH